MSDVHLTMNRMKKEGRIRYKNYEDSEKLDLEVKLDDVLDLPAAGTGRNLKNEKIKAKLKKAAKAAEERRKRKLALIPRNRQESPIFCLMCQKAFSLESHFAIIHKDQTKEDIRLHIFIGRAIVNRMKCVGTESEFECLKDQPGELYQRITDLYGERPTKSLTNAGRVVKLLDEISIDCNTLLQKLSEDGSNPKLRHSVIPIKTFRICRLDIARYQHIYCIACDEWTRDSWANHRTVKHRKFTRLEELSVFLYSLRLKMCFVNGLLACDREVITKYGFFVSLKKRNYVLKQEFKITERTADLLHKTKLAARSMVNKVRVKSTEKTFVYKDLVYHFGDLLPNKIYAMTFRLMKVKFGSKFSGFFNWTLAAGRELTAEEIKACQNQHVSGVDTLCFLHRKTDETATKIIFHTALAWYHSLTNQCIIFESDAEDRKKPLLMEYLRLLKLYHFHIVPTMKVAYSKHFARQDNDWSCAYHAIFASICVMAHADPTHYQINLFGVFRMIKEAAILGKNAFLGKSVQDILKQIGQKKKRFSSTKDKLTLVAF